MDMDDLPICNRRQSFSQLWYGRAADFLGPDIPIQENRQRHSQLLRVVTGLDSSIRQPAPAAANRGHFAVRGQADGDFTVQPGLFSLL